MEKKLPKGWVETELRNIADIITGKKDANHATVDGQYCFFTCAFEPLKSPDFSYKGEVLILPGNGANVGEVFYYKGKFQAYQRTYIVQNVRLSTKYLFYHFKRYWKVRNLTLQYGSATNYIKIGNFNNYNVSFPPLAEQERIANKLDELFARIELIKKSMDKIPQLLKDFRQQVLTSAVTGKLTEEWREGKEIDHSSVLINTVIEERNKEIRNKINRKVIQGPFVLPRKWSWVLLNYLGEVSRGKSKHRPRNDRKLFGGQYPFIQTGDVSNCKGVISKYSVTYNDFGLSQSRMFPKGTLCITIAANIAETGILGFDSCFPDSIVGYVPYKNIYTSEFVMFYLKVIQKDLERFAPATAQKNINLSILNDVSFPFPPLIEQEEIVKRVESLFAKADQIEEQYKALKEKIDVLPQLLLHKAFKGELVEQLPTDGDAADLLKEIMALKKK